MPRFLLHHILIFWMLALQLSKTTRLLHPFQILMNLASNIYIISEIAFSLGVPFVPFHGYLSILSLTQIILYLYDSFFLRISILLVVFHLMLRFLLTYQVWGGVNIIPILRTYAICTLDYIP